MKKVLSVVFVLLSLCSGASWAAPAGGMMIEEIEDHYEPFGKIHLYKTSAAPRRVFIFLSGDGGWDEGDVRIAKSLVQPDSLMIGVDSASYVENLNKSAGKCTYAAAQLESLSQYIQKKYKFPSYISPVLVGFSSGATMVYAVLVQSPPNTFAGGISMGFCPDLQTAHPFCKGNGGLDYKVDPKLGFVYKVASRTASPWIVLQGDQDDVCSTPDSRSFVAKVGNAQMYELPKVGHGFSVQRNWVPQFRAAFQEILGRQRTDAPPERPIGDLPLIELPVSRPSPTLAVIVTGDGGWANIDKEIGETLREDGIPVVGLNALQYFWERKTPDVAAKDLERILRHYGSLWNAEDFILIGYSRGADTLPFMVSRLPDDLKQRIRSVALLGLGEETDFEFRVSDWVADGEGVYKTAPEVARLEGMNVLCFFGTEEEDSACRKLDPSKVKVIEKTGGHHFGGDYEGLAKRILRKE